MLRRRRRRRRPKLGRRQPGCQVGSVAVDRQVESPGLPIEDLRVESRLGAGRDVVEALVEVVTELRDFCADTGSPWIRRYLVTVPFTKLYRAKCKFL